MCTPCAAELILAAVLVDHAELFDGRKLRGIQKLPMYIVCTVNINRVKKLLKYPNRPRFAPPAD